MKFSIKDLFSKREQIRTISDFVTFTEEIFNGKLQFLYSDNILGMWKSVKFPGFYVYLREMILYDGSLGKVRAKLFEQLFVKAFDTKPD